MSVTKNSSSTSTRRRSLSGVFAQAFVHATHETVEVGAVLAAFRARRIRMERFQRQAVVEQVDQEGLAAADAAPQVQAAHRLGFLPERGQAIQPAILRIFEQGQVDPIQFAQRVVLCRIVAPAAFGDAARIGLRRRRGHRGIAVRHHASGSQAFIACLIAPRRSISLRWKKWLVSGMRISSGGFLSLSIQS
jgi:hypothetical protein